MVGDRHDGWIKRIFSKLSWINPFKVKKNANGTIGVNHKPFILNIISLIGSTILAVSIYLINAFRAGKPALWGLTKAEVNKIGWDELGPALEAARYSKGVEIFYKGFWQKTYKYIVIPLLSIAVWGVINSIRTRHKSTLRIMAEHDLEPYSPSASLADAITQYQTLDDVAVESVIKQDRNSLFEKTQFAKSPADAQEVARQRLNKQKPKSTMQILKETIDEAIVPSNYSDHDREIVENKIIIHEIIQAQINQIKSKWKKNLQNANENKFGFEYWKYFLFFREDNHNAAREQVNFPGRGMLNFLFPLAITFVSEWIIKKGVNECGQDFNVTYDHFIHNETINWKNHILLEIEAYGKAGKEIWTFAEFKSVILYRLVPLSALVGISLFGILAAYGINCIRAYYQDGKEEAFKTIPGEDGYYIPGEQEPLILSS